MKRIPKLGEHLRLKAARELLAKLRRDDRETEEKLNQISQRPVANPESDAVTALLEGKEPGRIELHDAESAQLHARRAALARAIDKQDHICRQLENPARREMIEEHGLRDAEREALVAVKREAERFGAVCTMLDKFYDECREADLALPAHSWPLHPGTASDANSNLNQWLRDLKANGVAL